MAATKKGFQCFHSIKKVYTMITRTPDTNNYIRTVGNEYTSQSFTFENNCVTFIII